MTDDLSARLNALRTRALDAQRREHELMDLKHRQDSAALDSDREFMLSQCRVAQPWEYSAWLRGFMEGGGSPDHFYDYLTPKMWVAMSHLQVRPLYGAFALKILVPEGITEDGGDTGHTALFITDGGQYRSRGFHGLPASVSVWLDTEI